MSNEKTRAILDTNVVVAGMLWNGLPRRLLAVAAQGQLDCYSSLELLAELSNTLAYPKFKQRIAAMNTSVAVLTMQYEASVNITPFGCSSGAISCRLS